MWFVSITLSKSNIIVSSLISYLMHSLVMAHFSRGRLTILWYSRHNGLAILSTCSVIFGSKSLITPFWRRSSSISHESESGNGYFFSSSSFSVGRILERQTPFLSKFWRSCNSDQFDIGDGHHLFSGIMRELNISLEFNIVLLWLSKTKGNTATVSYCSLHVMRFSSQLLKSSGLAYLQDAN